MAVSVSVPAPLIARHLHPAASHLAICGLGLRLRLRLRLIWQIAAVYDQKSPVQLSLVVGTLALAAV